MILAEPAILTRPHLSSLIDGLHSPVHALGDVDDEELPFVSLPESLDDVRPVAGDVAAAVGLYDGPLHGGLQEGPDRLHHDGGENSEQPDIPVQFGEHRKLRYGCWTENISDIN